MQLTSSSKMQKRAFLLLSSNYCPWDEIAQPISIFITEFNPVKLWLVECLYLPAALKEAQRKNALQQQQQSIQMKKQSGPINVSNASLQQLLQPYTRCAHRKDLTLYRRKLPVQLLN